MHPRTWSGVNYTHLMDRRVDVVNADILTAAMISIPAQRGHFIFISNLR
jgi:hypothetical protein